MVVVVSSPSVDGLGNPILAVANKSQKNVVLSVVVLKSRSKNSRPFGGRLKKSSKYSSSYKSRPFGGRLKKSSKYWSSYKSRPFGGRLKKSSKYWLHSKTKGCRSLGYRFVHGTAVDNIAYHPDLRSRLCSAGSQLPNWEKCRRRLRPQKIGPCTRCMRSYMWNTVMFRRQGQRVRDHNQGIVCLVFWIRSGLLSPVPSQFPRRLHTEIPWLRVRGRLKGEEDGPPVMHSCTDTAALAASPGPG